MLGKKGKYYQVVYEDGDSEELTEKQLGEYVRLPPERGGVIVNQRLPNAVRENGKRERGKVVWGEEGGGREKQMGDKVRRLGLGEEGDDPESFVAAAQESLTAGLAKKTASKYRTVMSHFKTFLILDNLDWDAVGVLASQGGGNVAVLSSQNETLMMGFAEYLVTERRIEVKSAKQYITNIKTQLGTMTGFDPSYGNRWLRMGRLWGRLAAEYPARPRQREPFLQQHLLRLRGKLDLTQRSFQMYWAAVLLLFFVVGRKADHFSATRSGFDAKTDTTRSDIRYSSDDLLVVEIKETKTRTQDRHHPGKPLVRDEGNPLCPVTALEAYFASDPLGEGEDPNVTPLFRHENGSAVSGDDIHKFVKLAATNIGLDAKLYGGHSLRIGGATAALASASGDKYSVQVLGMWMGESVRLYTRPTMSMLSVLLLEMMRSKQTTTTGEV